jgi:signal transduction histidine kinase
MDDRLHHTDISRTDSTLTDCINLEVSCEALVDSGSRLSAPTLDNQDLAVETPMAATLLDELSDAFAAVDQAVFIVSRITRCIQWVSASCQSVHPQIDVGNPVNQVPGLATWLSVVEAGDSPASLLMEVPVAERPETSLHNLPESEVQVQPLFEITLMRVSDSFVSLRCKPFARPDDFLHRYVAEREKLFMLSRSVSISEMATTLAHELNQPIGTIANLLQGLQMLLLREYDGKPPEALALALMRASDQTRFAADIINRIRNFTEARAPRLAACEAGELLGGTIELLDWVFDSKQVRVNVEIQDQPVYVSGDHILLQQVFANLLRNAVDALQSSPPGTARIDIRIGRSVDGVIIDVADNGPGLPKKSADTPFEPFRSSKPEGMGIGLNICRSFIEMHRGKLWLTTGESGGCTAHVLLPESEQ